MSKIRLESNQIILYVIIGTGVLSLILSLLVMLYILTFIIKNNEDATAVSSQQQDTINQAIELYRSQE
jgi:ABC-type uncharacterized transport system permease subunit